MKPTTRLQFGELFETVRKFGIGAEIGVQRGLFSEHLLGKWSGVINCVDVWNDITIYEEAKKRLSGDRTILHKGTSAEMAKKFEDESLDWVYIDAAHDYENVKLDYNTWLPKVRKGGIISGHDYGVNPCIGVKEFIDEIGKDQFNFTTGDFWNSAEYQSWWKIKE